MAKQFEYVGPEEVRAQARHSPPGAPIVSHEAMVNWLRQTGKDVSSEGGWATYIVDLRGYLVLAPRRTEHVACAQGTAVLAAGEIRFTTWGEVVEVTNNSTGYCPAEDSWESVQLAIAQAELPHPPGFTYIAQFRRCPTCGERNLVKDDWYHCALCEAELPLEWNF